MKIFVYLIRIFPLLTLYMEFNEIVRNNLGNYITSFYLAIKHINEKYLKEYLDKFIIKSPTLLFVFYTKEICSHTHHASGGEHFHFIVAHSGDNEQINKKVTNSLMRHYVNKFNLAGNSQGTRVRQYGLIQKRIRSVCNIIRYCCKSIDWETQNYNLILREHNEEFYTNILDTIKSLPQWDDKEDEDPKKFFLQTLEEIKRQPPEILNNQYSLIGKILHFYDLAKKHPPVKATIEKYLRIIDYSKLTTNQFIDKYYLN